MARDYSMEEVLEAIEDSHGNMSVIKNRLRCAWHTAESYVNKWDETKLAFKDENEIMLDICAGLLETKIIRDKDEATAKWVLARRGRHRGYGDNVAVEGNVSYSFVDMVQKVNAERRAQRTNNND